MEQELRIVVWGVVGKVELNTEGWEEEEEEAQAFESRLRHRPSLSSPICLLRPTSHPVPPLFFFSRAHSHKSITEEERTYIIESIASQQGRRIDVPTPWKCILTSSPVWAIVVMHTCQNWGFYTLLTCIPTYFNDVLQFDISSVRLPGEATEQASAIEQIKQEEESTPRLDNPPPHIPSPPGRLCCLLSVPGPIYHNPVERTNR
jgi:hypothetical protein